MQTPRTTPDEQSVEWTLDRYEDAVIAMACKHAPSTEKSYPVCAACVRETPLSKATATAIDKAKRFDNAVAEAEADVDAAGRDPGMVRADLGETYVETYFDECAPPGECLICAEAVDDPDMQCGHDDADEPCPHPNRDGGGDA